MLHSRADECTRTERSSPVRTVVGMAVAVLFVDINRLDPSAMANVASAAIPGATVQGETEAILTIGHCLVPPIQINITGPGEPNRVTCGPSQGCDFRETT